MGMGAMHVKSPERRDRLWLINAFAVVLLTLLGAAGEALGYDRMLKTNTAKHRVHSLFRQGCMLYDLMPTMREEWLGPLMQRFSLMLHDQPLFADIFLVRFACKSMDAFVISSLPSLCWRHCKWQGPLAPRTLLRFVATTDPAATLSSSADFPVSPVIRPTLLRRFLAGTRRVSPVAQHVLVTVLSLPPRQGNQPYRSVFGWSFCLRPSVAGSALGNIHFRGHNAFTFVTAR